MKTTTHTTTGAGTSAAQLNTLLLRNETSGLYWDGRPAPMSFSASKVNALPVDAADAAVIRATYAGTVAETVPSGFAAKVARIRKLEASAKKIRREKGLATSAWNHNSMVAMRIGQADAMESRARGLKAKL